jgi:hypothetical protein
MKQSRISRQRVLKFAHIKGYDLITHQNLGNRKDYYYYTYSLVTKNERDTILFDKELKEIYSYLLSN